MNCDDVRDHLLSGGAPDADGLREHAQSCEGCRELVTAPGLMAALGAPSAPADFSRLKQLVQQDLAADTAFIGRLKSLSSSQRRALLLVVAAAIVAVEATALVRKDIHLLTAGDLVPTLLPLGVLALAGVWMALRPLQQRALPGALVAALVGVALATPVVLAFLQPSTGHPASLLGTDGNLLRYVATCLAHGAALAAVLWLAFAALDRGGLGPARYAAGATASVVAILGLALHCPIGHSAHWLLGHAGVGLVVIAGVFWGATLRRKG